jgi:hypothetical protein
MIAGVQAWQDRFMEPMLPATMATAMFNIGADRTSRHSL